MMRLTEQSISRLGQRASQIEELCGYLAEALQSDPVTSGAGVAVEGLGTLARGLARELYDFAEPID